MSDTKIEWTDATWNPVRGCSRVSDGCRNCYAEHQAMRITRFDRGRNIPEGKGAYDGLVTTTSQGPKWTGQIREVMEKLHEPLAWKKPKLVFVNSMSDLFHKGVSDRFIADVFACMAYASQHTFQVLTKQPERMLSLLTSATFAKLYDEACKSLGRARDIPATAPSLPLPNVWLGVSVENQPTADERIPLLLQTPAAVRFISAEPLLGPVDLRNIAVPKEQDTLRRAWDTEGYKFNALQRHDDDHFHQAPATLDWVIAGGESGHDARPTHPDWIRGLRNQCNEEGVKFFFKQWGAWLPVETSLADEVFTDDGSDRELHATHGVVVTKRHGMEFAKVTKKVGGRLLDGREWNEYPEAACC